LALAGLVVLCLCGVGLGARALTAEGPKSAPKKEQVKAEVVDPEPKGKLNAKKELQKAQGVWANGDWVVVIRGEHYCCGTARGKLKVVGKVGDVVQADLVLTDSARKGRVDRLAWRRDGNVLHLVSGPADRDHASKLEDAGDYRYLKYDRWTDGEK
jgi:hypothetical protein